MADRGGGGGGGELLAEVRDLWANQCAPEGHTTQEQPLNPVGGRERRGVLPQNKGNWILTSAEKGKGRAREEDPAKRVIPLVVAPPQLAKRATAKEELLPYDEPPPTGDAIKGGWCGGADWSSDDNNYGETEHLNPSRFSTSLVGDWLIIRVPILGGEAPDLRAMRGSLTVM
ncbi:hypothetical protein BV22DRAFT_1052752 [Leucogyrophana mollusca]|uniref:Uncharacterized protein n=1 Tax=Leucogyrophana mollusca TaxID=85980 RepID=A0ACB8AX63_9AGAM|nr:hypothetical protein BV22DRAFT_1052752 [Leucogyrophana mollusca]